MSVLLSVNALVPTDQDSVARHSVSNGWPCLLVSGDEEPLPQRALTLYRRAFATLYDVSWFIATKALMVIDTQCTVNQ